MTEEKVLNATASKETRRTTKRGQIDGSRRRWVEFRLLTWKLTLQCSRDDARATKVHPANPGLRFHHVFGSRPLVAQAPAASCRAKRALWRLRDNITIEKLPSYPHFHQSLGALDSPDDQLTAASTLSPRCRRSGNGLLTLPADRGQAPSGIRVPMPRATATATATITMPLLRSRSP